MCVPTTLYYKRHACMQETKKNIVFDYRLRRGFEPGTDAKKLQVREASCVGRRILPPGPRFHNFRC